MFLQGHPTPKLGLDLAGGTTVTLTAVTEAGKSPPEAQMNQALEIMRDRVNGLGVSDAEVSKQGSNVIVVNVPGEGQDRVVQLIGTTAQLQFRQVYAISDAVPDAPASTAPSGTAKPTPKPTPSVSPSGTATPRGRAVPPALAEPTPAPSGSAPAQPSAPASPPVIQPQQPAETFEGITDKAVIAQYQQLTCAKGKRVPGADDPRKQWVAVCSQEGDAKYILGPVQVEGRQVSDANAVPPNAQQGQNSWQVSLQFRSQGGRQFADVTTKAYQAYQMNPGSPQQYVAIVLDGQVISAPSITNGAITGGQASIYGPPESFNQQYAADLANVLKYGALPLKFTPSSIDEVSSTLGDDQLRGGLIAGAIGLGLVVIYSMIYYRGLGLVSVFSLLVAAGLTYLSVVVLGENIGFRLSLPHIIGLIVSIGITADSFIVYFERLRDELRAGRPLRPSVEVAWRRARRTILVADAVTFIAALVLFFLAVGGVAGFAFAMGLTTLIDVVVVFMFTKPLVALLARTRFFGRGHKWSGLDVDRLRQTGTATRSMRQEA
ncbi:protein translocase subunit SecD [Actinomadura craniellae]|uniref:Protein translocase subunit SecD n=2 Tax=Actinomadura craniellae TaxID=2231787 RepID=A0A365HEN1_9ACTN|nr:protein translocase subunit SecD [Actinomadura craniellae]